jgi:hypothetical protein
MTRQQPQVRLIVQGRSGLIAALAGGLVVAGLGIWLVIAILPRLLHTPVRPAGTPAEPAVAGTATTETRRINATLFYVSADGTELTGRLLWSSPGTPACRAARRPMPSTRPSARPGRICCASSGRI